MSFEFVAVGNWWSEYRCTECDKHVVVHDDGDQPKACPHCGASANADCGQESDSGN